MKTQHSQYSKLFISLLLFSFPAVFLSCHTYNFVSPQPTDKKNIYEFPESMRGTWKPDEEKEMIFIGRDYVTYRNYGKEKIVKGIMPVTLNDSGMNLNYTYRPFYRTRFDSVKNVYDTFPNYLVEGKYIYDIEMDGKLGNRNYYLTEKDTITLLRNDSVTVDLGANAFLRQLNNEFYLLNIRNSVMGEEGPWWQIIIVQIKKNNQLCLWDIEEKLETDPSMFYHPKSTGYYYFNCNWTTPDIFQMMKENKITLSSTLDRVNKNINK